MRKTCDFFTLADVVNQLLLRKGNIQRKYFETYLSIAQDSFRDLFKNTLFVVQNKWIPLQQCAGDPYPFIRIPKDSMKVIGVYERDECGNEVPIHYNNEMEVLPIPTTGACGKCGGTSLGAQVNNFSVTTTPVVIGGITYYERTYLKYTENGSIYEYREVPTQQFREIVQAGDYNNDYNNDYNTVAAFPSYTVVMQPISSLVCSLKTKECGCPVDSPENEETFISACGCKVDLFCRQKYCDKFMAAINPNGRGEIKFSDCGTKIYFRQRRHTPKPLQNNGWLKLKYQTSGIKVGQEIIVPEYSRKALWADINYEAMRFNPKYSINQVEYARIQKVHEDNELILYLNQFNMERLAQIQDAPNKW